MQKSISLGYFPTISCREPKREFTTENGRYFGEGRAVLYREREREREGRKVREFYYLGI